MKKQAGLYPLKALEKLQGDSRTNNNPNSSALFHNSQLKQSVGVTGISSNLDSKNLNDLDYIIIRQETESDLKLGEKKEGSKGRVTSEINVSQLQSGVVNMLNNDLQNEDTMHSSAQYFKFHKMA